MMKSLALFLCLKAIAADVTLVWDANDPAEMPERYYVYQSTNLNTPFVGVTNSVTNSVRVILPTNGQYFFYVTASNFWGESAQSNTANTPKVALRVANPKLQR